MGEYLCLKRTLWRRGERNSPQDWRYSYLTFELRRHMQQFEEALKADETSMLSDFTEAPNSPVVGPQQLSLPPQSQRVRKVSALSDFAPVNLKVRKYVATVHPLLRSA